MATIKDVAKLAGVGLGTASRVVTGNGSVAPETLARVRRAIDELGFRPSLAARALQTGTSRMIGVYIPVLAGTFYTPLLRLIDTELRAAGLHMVLAFGTGLGDGRQQVVESLQFLIERGCDGLLVVTGALHEDDIPTLGPKGKRLIALNRVFTGLADQCFTVDHVLGGRMAARTLLGHKHRRIAVVEGPHQLEDNVARVAGFMDELAQHGIDPASVWRVESDFSPAGGWAAAKQWHESGHGATAMFCANDEMAVGALSYFQEAGVRVPRDMSVLGYDDTPAAAYAAPRLSTVHMPWREMTLNGINALLNQCYDMRRPVTRDYPVSITLRASLSTASPRRKSPGSS